MSISQESSRQLGEHTSTSAFLVIGTGASGLVPGARGIPRKASTAFLGGGRRQHVMNLIALTFVSVAMCFLTARQTAVISSGVNWSKGCGDMAVKGIDTKVLRIQCKYLIPKRSLSP